MRIFIFLLMLILAGCISTHYTGKSYTPTKELAIYYSKEDLPKGKHQTIGELKVIADTTCSSESIINKIREESMSRGADIAIIGWFDSRFITEKTKHNESCDHEHCTCCHHEKDPYKHKKVIKVILMKNNKEK